MAARRASCHEPLPPRGGYVCRCDVEGYIGHASTSSQATCSKADEGDDGDDAGNAIAALQDTVAVLKEDVAEVQDQAVEVAARADGLQSTLQATDSRAEVDHAAIETLQSSMAEVTSTVATLDTECKRDVKGLQAQIDALQATNAKLVKALKAAVFEVPTPADTAGGGSNGGGGGGAASPPSVETSGDGTINMNVANGKHVTVNSEAVLVADEVRSLIKQAITDALQGLGGTLG